jgi:ribosomal protein S1
MSKNINYHETIQNINLSKTLYTKNILRYKKATDVGLLDSGFTLSNALIKVKETTGDSVLYSPQTLKHRNYKQLKVSTFLPFEQLSASYKLAANFNQSLKQLTEENSKNYLQILSPVKGGFFGYYAGIYGFIPRSHFKKIIIQSLNIKNKPLANQLYFADLHESNYLLKPRTLFKVGKLTIQPYNVVNNFNDVKVRKIFNSALNFVFVSNK